jgi:hypothetical protein
MRLPDDATILSPEAKALNLALSFSPFFMFMNKLNQTKHTTFSSFVVLNVL